MGSSIKDIATTAGTGGLNKVGGALGISSGDTQGAFYTPQQQASNNYMGFANNYDDQMRDIESGVQGGALTSGVYGTGGLQSQLGTEGQQLANQGFNLTQGDQQAYGQASGDISRLFGQQDQAASQALQRRGLGSASSGAAGATFSGLAGNKNEMLAKAQTDIAQKRMQDTQNRLMQNRQLQAQLASQGGALADARLGQKGQNLFNAANLQNQDNAQSRQSLQDQQANVHPGLFSTIGQGLQSGIGQVATAAPGAAFGAATGSPAGLGGGSALGGKQNTMGGQNSQSYGNYA